ncbi:MULTISPECIES: MFS transporter [Pseudomonas]|uniref:MFS transporter n=1 Tax=Pseudomonas nitroreducens TaxID=46680 RepID=A0A6G6IUE3_PSENT|nr:MULTISPECIES: MFS transporter [Pseudomonas]MBG6288758.1 MFS transporter [Pseudomonas nitroreducens]MCJ1879485.1 MFS transporter [Pseudomonas nitroreducens]MCJ1893844.1 MFS transporter [Pseudomonas nitroreducens]MDG9855251.1 MFS transporter [Pseudomonas nitroreducens]MDH1076951.1 MFS transporter [Pseudomonas nitroreducens]
MLRIVTAFRALYFAAVMLLTGSGLLSTYLALRLGAEKVDGLWIGAMMAAYYLGLVLGGKIGHRLIARVGHIRAYVACGGLVTAAVLGIGLLPWVGFWLVLRVAIGLGMMCQYMVIESWLNEQAEARQRGLVFAGYMVASYLGLVLGQLVLVVHPGLGPELPMLIALCFALSLIPVAITHKVHPAPLRPAPLEPRFFIQRVPQSLTTVLVSGLVIGSFYGLAPLYAVRQGLSTEEIGLFMGGCIFAGLVVQWPLGWLSDRYDRAALIRNAAILLLVVALPLALLPVLPLPPMTLAWLLPLGFVVCLVQFTLYPLAVAFSNDHVEGERRVSLTAMLLVTFGVGACIGPLAAGALMKVFGANMLYAFVCACSLILIWRVRPERVSGVHRVDEAPVKHVATPDSLASSPLSAALDPRVDEAAVEEQMKGNDNSAPVPEKGTEAEEESRPA